MILLLALGMAINHASEVAGLILPKRFLFDCSTLPPEQQAIVRNHGLPAIGIWKKCK
jgi:hypothetical protein